jgi:hypothetical protein
MLEAYATLASGARMMVVLPSTNLRIIGEASSNRMAIDEFGEETGVPDEFALREYFKSNPIHSVNAKARGSVKNKQVTQVHISRIYSLVQSFNASRACAFLPIYVYPTVVFLS